MCKQDQEARAFVQSRAGSRATNSNNSNVQTLKWNLCCPSPRSGNLPHDNYIPLRASTLLLLLSAPTPCSAPCGAIRVPMSTKMHCKPGLGCNAMAQTTGCQANRCVERWALHCKAALDWRAIHLKSLWGRQCRLIEHDGRG